MTATIDLGVRPITEIARLGAVSSAFLVETRLELDGARRFTERPVAAPWMKTYEGPAAWAALFDMARWGFVAAEEEGVLVAGAVIAFDTPGVDMLEGRRDLAVLWDIRVDPGYRGLGVGAALLAAAEAWARARGCIELKVETQDINAPACAFYAKHGFALRAAHPGAYADYPDEVQLIWRKALA